MGLLQLCWKPKLREMALTLVVVVALALNSVEAASSDTRTCEALPVITFGLTTALSDGDNYTGIFYRDGIQAAFDEYNQDVEPDQKFVIQLKTLDDADNTQRAIQNVKTLVQDSTIFGIIGVVGSAKVEATAPFVINAKKPFLPAYGGSSLRDPFQRYVVNVRASYYDESAAVVEYLVGVGRTRIAVFAQNDSFGAAVVNGVGAALNSSNLYIHSTSYCTPGASSATLLAESQTALKTMAASRKAPTAIVVATAYEAAVMMLVMSQQKWNDIYTAALSPVASALSLTDASEHESGPITNLVMSQIVPMPADSSLPIAKRFMLALGTNTASASFSGFEGYLMGRLAIEALQRVRGFNYTAEKFLDAIYKNSYFNFDDLRMGPFYPVNISSGCNQGMREVFLLTINRSSGLLEQSTSLSFPTTCGYKPKEWQRITFGMSCSFKRGTSQAMNCQSFYQGVSAAFKEVNDDGGIRGTSKLFITQTDDAGVATKAVAAAEKYLKDDSIFGLIGFGVPGILSVANLATQYQKILVGSLAGNLNIRYPFQRYVLNFRASVADELFAILHYCYYVKHLRKLTLLYEETEFGFEAREDFIGALNEKRLVIHAEGSYNDSLYLTTAVQAIIDTGGDMQALVFTGMDQVLETVVKMVHAHNNEILVFGVSTTDAARLTHSNSRSAGGGLGGGSGSSNSNSTSSSNSTNSSNSTSSTSSLQPPSPPPSDSGGSTGSQGSSNNASSNSTTTNTSSSSSTTSTSSSSSTTSLTNVSVNWENVLITQTVPSVENTSSHAVQAYIAAMASLDESMMISTEGLEGYLVGQLVAVALNRILGKDLSVENMLEVVYENGNFNLDGLRCGPFEEESTNADGSTTGRNCSQCMKSVYLINFNVNGTALNELGTFSFADACMYEPLGNLDFQFGTRIVFVILAGIGIGYVLIVMVLIVVYRTNEHVRASSYRFSLVSCFGGILCYCGVFLLYPIPTDVTCALAPWLSNVAFVTLFGPIFAKTYRIDKLFNTKKLKRRVISDRQVFEILLMLLLVFVVFLIVWMILDRPYMEESFTAAEWLRYETCKNKHQTFSLVDIILKAFVLLWGCFLCQRVYKIKGQFAKFNESKQMVMCIFHTSFLASCMLILNFATKDNPNLQYICDSVVLLENTTVVVTILYTRVVYFAIIGKVHTDDGDEGDTTTSGDKTSAATTAFASRTTVHTNISGTVQNMIKSKQSMVPKVVPIQEEHPAAPTSKALEGQNTSSTTTTANTTTRPFLTESQQASSTPVASPVNQTSVEKF